MALKCYHMFQAPGNSTELQNYHKGVQMGCWGLVVYAATAAVGSGKTQTLFLVQMSQFRVPSLF